MFIRTITYCIRGEIQTIPCEESKHTSSSFIIDIKFLLRLTWAAMNWLINRIMCHGWEFGIFIIVKGFIGKILYPNSDKNSLIFKRLLVLTYEAAISHKLVAVLYHCKKFIVHKEHLTMSTAREKNSSIIVN